MKQQKFPSVLYIQEESISKGNLLDAWVGFDNCEEDGTVAVYRLEKICRVKVEKKIVLVDEEKLLVIMEKSPLGDP